MAIYSRKRRADILREALWSLQQQTPISSTSPGSVARAFTESISEQLGDMYDALEFNLAQSVISTASGSGLDLLANMYNVKRRTLSNLFATEAVSGSFAFYIKSPHTTDIVIPINTAVYTGIDSFIGRQLRYLTTSVVTIEAGRLKAFASIKPQFSSAGFSAAPKTLTVHDFTSPPGVPVFCTNYKAISPQEGQESDDNLRIRVIKSIRVTTSGTAEAIRFAGLAVGGVRDIRVRQAPYGMGTFEALVVAEDPNTIQVVMTAVQSVVDRVRPVGVRMILKNPEVVILDFSASLILSSSADSDIVSQARNAVLRYINTLLPGEVLVYNRIMQAIMDVSPESILDVKINSYAPRGIETVRRNWVPKAEEQIIPGRVTIDIASS